MCVGGDPANITFKIIQHSGSFRPLLIVGCNLQQMFVVCFCTGWVGQLLAQSL